MAKTIDPHPHVTVNVTDKRADAEKTTTPEAAGATQTPQEVVQDPPTKTAAIAKANLYAKLLLIENEIGAVEKTGTNESQGWKYMEHSEIVSRLRPLFAKYRVKYLYTEESNEITLMERWDKDAKQVVPGGAKSHKKAKHLLVNCDNPAEIFEGYTFAEANSTSDKASNASSTYGHKLFLLRTFNLTDQDPDAQAIEAAPVKPSAKVSKSKETDIYTMLERLNIDVETYEAKYAKANDKPEGFTVQDMSNAEADAEIQKMVAFIQRKRVSSAQKAA